MRSQHEHKDTGPFPYPVVRVPAVPLPGYPSFRLGLPSRRLRNTLIKHQADVVHLASPVVLGAHGAAVAKRLGLPAIAVFQTDLPSYAHAYRLGRHRFVACQFHALLAAAGYPVGPGPDPEPSTPPPSRMAEVGWMATKGTMWLVRRSRDLVPALVALAVREWLTAEDEVTERELVPVSENPST